MDNPISSSGPSLGSKIVKTVLKWGIGLLVAVALLASLWTWGALTFVYSAGERAGYVQKFSKKGWIIKTWEGELAMVNLPGAMPEIFKFTVRKPNPAKLVEETMGKRVVLRYEEHRGVPPHLFGDTSHYVVEVREVQQDESSAPAPVPAAPAPPKGPTT